MKNCIDGKLVEMTAEEISQANEYAQQEADEQAHRPMTPDEVADILIRAQVNNVDIPDQTSLRMMDYYPSFDTLIGQTLKQGYKLTCGGALYKTAQVVTVQEIYKPGETGTESLYTRIDMDHLGNKYDPVPYSGNMELISGKYYTQDGILYLCSRDTGAAVFNPLSELVGLYVEVA